METVFIFFRGVQLPFGLGDFQWYLERYQSLEDAEKACPSGWRVQKYCDFEWRY